MMRDLMLVSVHALYGALQGANHLLGNMINGAKQGNDEKEKQTKNMKQSVISYFISFHHIAC